MLYKNARVDQAILDETFGIFGWQRHHTVIGGSLYCSVSVWDEEHQDWIMKQDVGSESDYEKEKGAASDSFKRACVNLGIGRELYTAPLDLGIRGAASDSGKRPQENSERSLFCKVYQYFRR